MGLIESIKNILTIPEEDEYDEAIEETVEKEEPKKKTIAQETVRRSEPSARILGGGKDYLIGDLIEDYFLGNSGVVNYNVGAALSMVLMILILIATFFMNRFDKDAKTSGGGRI